MSLAVLRRMRALVPHPITTSLAPRPAAGVDIVHTPQQPVAAPVVPAAAVLPDRALDRLGVPRQPPAERPLTTTPAHPSLPSAPPSWTPGICHHDGHIDHAGVRVGVLVLDDASASLLRCEHFNRDGR